MNAYYTLDAGKRRLGISAEGELGQWGASCCRRIILEWYLSRSRIGWTVQICKDSLFSFPL